MMPVRRDLKFRLGPAHACNWHAMGPQVTHFANAMSLFFPDGERFFIHTVRHYRDRIESSALQQAVSAFIGQEALHGREHEDYNRLLDQAGLPAQMLQDHARDFLEWVKRMLPPSAQLSTTIAQEHFTAILAELVLTDPRILEGADAQLAALWRWHALEETEHKAVAFDVYQATVGRGSGAYALRCAGMVLTTAAFLGLTLYYQQRLQAADARVRRWEGLGRFGRFMLRSPALLPRLATPWLRYFRPGFHPWDHDNRYLLDQIDTLVATASAGRDSSSALRAAA